MGWHDDFIVPEEHTGETLKGKLENYLLEFYDNDDLQVGEASDYILQLIEKEQKERCEKCAFRKFTTGEYNEPTV